jgi:hypothetical protein
MSSQNYSRIKTKKQSEYFGAPINVHLLRSSGSCQILCLYKCISTHCHLQIVNNMETFSSKKLQQLSFLALVCFQKGLHKYSLSFEHIDVHLARIIVVIAVNISCKCYLSSTFSKRVFVGPQLKRTTSG